MLWLRFTDRADGNMALHTLDEGEDPSPVLAARRKVLFEGGLDLDDLVLCEQVHGAEVRVVGSRDRGRGADDAADAFPAADGLVTFERGVALMVLGADCPLVALHDPIRPGLGVFHAGWRGLSKRVLERGLELLDPRDEDEVQAFLSPCIGPCCYKVGEEVAALFPVEAVPRLIPGEGPRLDLLRAVQVALDLPLELGKWQCTSCSLEYESWRREQATRRQGLVAALR